MTNTTAERQTGVRPELVFTHPEFNFVRKELHKVRVAVEGSLAVKAERYTYLPHPSQVETTSPEQRQRYTSFLADAEYRNDAQATKRQLLGKMDVKNSTIELPEALAYLEDNVDGDGQTLQGAMEYANGEALEMKWHFLVADYAGLSDVEIDQVSIADIEEANPRAQVKQYSRDALVNWSFKRVDGIMQLSYLEFRELGTEFDYNSGVHTDVYSYLVLALDNEGNYYQQKKVYGGEVTRDDVIEDEQEENSRFSGERNYVTVNGQSLRFIPVAIVSDEELPTNCLPRDMSFLHEIVEISLQRYRMSARYKETQTANIPTKWTKGWRPGDKEIFEDVNQRDHISVGGYGINNLPNDVEMGISSASADMSDFQWDFQRYDTEVAKLGGTNESGDRGNLTATEAEIIANNINALLNSLATSSETAWQRMMYYCGVFEGVFNIDGFEQAMEQIRIETPRDFAKSRLSVEEVRAYIELWLNGIVTRETLLKQVKNGGWLEEELDVLVAARAEQGDNGDLPPVDDGE